MKLYLGAVLGLLVGALAVEAHYVTQDEPEMVVHVPPNIVLVTYCNKIPVGVILTTEPPSFIAYEDMDDSPVLEEAVPTDRLSHFDICPAKTRT